MALLSFSDDDVRLLRDVIRRERLRKRNRGTGPTPDDLPPQSSDCYIVKLPAGGIDGLDETGDDPIAGAADCNVWITVDDGSGNMTMTETDYQIKALNFGLPIGYDAWCMVQRTKFGAWVITGVPPLASVITAEVNEASGVAAGATSFAIDNVTVVWPIGAELAEEDEPTSVTHITGLPAGDDAHVIAFRVSDTAWWGIPFTSTSECP